MGLVKNAWIESEARGWDAPEKFVCEECVSDLFLKKVISESLAENNCDYCGREGEVLIAAPVESVMGIIAETVHAYYATPEDAGVPYVHGEWAVSTMEIADVLWDLGFEGHPALFDDLLSSFNSACWVETGSGFGDTTRTHQRLRLAWKAFVEMVKHKTRFHFLALRKDKAYDRDYLTPDNIFSSIAELLRKFEFLKTVPEGVPIFRCRERGPLDNWKLDESQLGAPPSIEARAGRMNPAGISYFYGAFEPGTAMAEVIQLPPTAAGLGVFFTSRPLQVVDLTKIPPLPSVFDGEQRDAHDAILFLGEFTRQISQPVQRNGMEHIEYLPSQVICEYLAQVFDIDGNGNRLDGIVYPSTKKEGSTNIVLFPTERSWKYRFDGLKFVGAKALNLRNWDSIINALSMSS